MSIWICNKFAQSYTTSYRIVDIVESNRFRFCDDGNRKCNRKMYLLNVWRRVDGRGGGRVDLRCLFQIVSKLKSSSREIKLMIVKQFQNHHNFSINSQLLATTYCYTHIQQHTLNSHIIVILWKIIELKVVKMILTYFRFFFEKLQVIARKIV